MIRRWLGMVALVGAAPVAAQHSTRAAGVVIRPDAVDSVPVAGTRVVLHQVGRATQGPIDTVVTDARGRFQFRFRVDSTANYLISARHAGIEYFSQPLATNPARPDTAIRLLVHDTSTAVAVTTRSRTWVIGAPDAIGARTVIDWLVLANRDRRTRVGADTLSPTWAAALPLGVRNTQVGDARLSQISPEAVEFRSDSVFVLAPISPGEKELLLQYELPRDQRDFTVAFGSVDSVDVFVEEARAAVGAGWRQRDSQRFEGRMFRRLERTEPALAELTIRFPGTVVSTEVLPYLVAATAVALLLGTWLALRRRAPVPHRVDPTALADRIARLDLEVREAAPEAADALRQQRATLLAELRATLAGGNRPS